MRVRRSTSSLVAVLAQRLVRTLCAGCRENSRATDAERALAGTDLAEIYRSRGCDLCRGTGYRGRTGVYELLFVDDTIRQMITTRQNAQAIKDYAVSRGLRTLFEDGIEKVRHGVTTIEEVLRVTQRDYGDLPQDA